MRLIATVFLKPPTALSATPRNTSAIPPASILLGDPISLVSAIASGRLVPSRSILTWATGEAKRLRSRRGRGEAARI